MFAENKKNYFSFAKVVYFFSSHMGLEMQILKDTNEIYFNLTETPIYKYNTQHR
jgi:hypothetical protein